jgi:benzil reductase ((S)-benzoin forming)
MKYYIITGSSKGLGESLTKRLLGNGNHVFCISRSKNEQLQASRSPRPQWVCYNSSKAGIDNITQTVAIEQNAVEHPVRIISFYPGPMDTAMRKENQKAKPLFKRTIEFIRNAFSAKKRGAHHPDFVAGKIVAHMSSPQFGKELFVSLEDVA